MNRWGRYNVFKDHIQLQDYEIHDGMVSTSTRPSPRRADLTVAELGDVLEGIESGRGRRTARGRIKVEIRVVSSE